MVPLLKTLNDSERSFQRLLLQRGGPQDLGVIRDMMKTCVQLSEAMRAAVASSHNAYLQTGLGLLESVQASPLLASLSHALCEVLLHSNCDL